MSVDETAPAALPRVEIRVDRWQALMRAMWRLLASVICGGGCFILLHPNWKLLRQTEMASFVALVTVFVLLAIVTIALVGSTVRWFLVAIWWRPMGIEIGPLGIRLSLGPAGERTYSWDQLRLRLDEAVDWEMLEMMPDDAFVPGIIDRATGEDLGPKIVKFTGISHEEFTRHLRPFLRHPPCPTG